MMTALLCFRQWALSPYCQYPNKASNQVLDSAQRFKNYLDEKYPDLYENSQKEFYHQMVDADLYKLIREVKPYDEKVMAKTNKYNGTDYLDYVKNLK